MIKFKCAVFLLLVFISSEIFSSEMIKPFILDKIPSALKFIQIKKTTLIEVENKIGKAKLIEGSHHYYEQDGFKYSLEIIYNDNRVDGFFYIFIKNRPSIANLELDLNLLIGDYKNGVANKYLRFSNNEIELQIDPIEKNIYSIRVKK